MNAAKGLAKDARRKALLREPCRESSVYILPLAQLCVYIDIYIYIDESRNLSVFYRQHGVHDVLGVRPFRPHADLDHFRLSRERGRHHFAHPLWPQALYAMPVS